MWWREGGGVGELSGGEGSGVVVAEGVKITGVAGDTVAGSWTVGAEQDGEPMPARGEPRVGGGVATRRCLGGLSVGSTWSSSMARGGLCTGDIVAMDGARKGNTDSSNTTWRDMMTR